MMITREKIVGRCDQGMIFSLCAMIFCLPASIAVMDSFAGLAVLFYFIKKINAIISDWPSLPMNLFHRIVFIIKGFSPRPNILNGPLAILTLAVFLSVVQSQCFGLSVLAFGGKFLKEVFLYFSFIEVFTDQKRIRFFLSALLISAFVIAIDGIVQHFFGMDFFKRLLPADGRVSASFRLGNTLGVYLIVILGIVVQQVCHAGERKYFSLGMLVLMLLMLMVCLTWTFSRASWVGFVSLMVFMIILDRRNIIYLIALLLVFLIFSLPILKTVRHVSLFRDNINHVACPTRGPAQNLEELAMNFLNEGGSGRVGFWHSAIFIIKKYPVDGSGLNTYTRMLKKFSLPLWYAHNGYLQMTAETGFVGLFSFLWMLFVLFKKGIGSIISTGDPWVSAVLKGALAALFGFLVESLLDNSLYVIQLEVLFWLMISLTAAVVNLNQKHG